MSGKGDSPRPVDMDKAVIYCVHSRFKDKCEKCKEASKAVEDKSNCKHCEFVKNLYDAYTDAREYYQKQQVFSYLHSGDVCNGGKDE